MQSKEKRVKSIHSTMKVRGRERSVGGNFTRVHAFFSCALETKVHARSAHIACFIAARYVAQTPSPLHPIQLPSTGGPCGMCAGVREEIAAES